MIDNVKNLSLLKRIWLIFASVGPGIFCIGYTIGTGSVTSMAKAGSQYGMKTMDKSLKELVQKGAISLDIAMSKVKNPEEFKQM